MCVQKVFGFAIYYFNKNKMETTTAIKEALQHKINCKTKPVGALGMLEDIALQVGIIQNTLTPAITKPHIVVFAADHGIAATGTVNPYPQAVTAQMVLNFANGGAAINVFCKQNNIGLTVVDAGVNTDFDPALKIAHVKIAKGTANYAGQSAMSTQQCKEAIAKGGIIVQDVFDAGTNCIGFGEMGIGNTSSASLIMAAVLGLPVNDCVGRGTGVNDEQLKTKIETLEKAFEKHQLSSLSNQPRPNVCPSGWAINLLTCIGGFEIAMMAGAYLKAAELNMIIVVDGFISTAALLIAQQLNEKIMGNCIFAHTSGEQGHVKMLEYLKVKPLLQLGMKLGEGTGTAIAIPLIQSAVNFLNEMASFESAGVSKPPTLPEIIGTGKGE
jgi:nicotinate-nucleotide--dimethylbenzimidazole phosphoribosyltransferase